MQMYSLRPVMWKLAEECKHLGNVLLECQHIAAVPASGMIHEHSLLLADFYGVNLLLRHVNKSIAYFGLQDTIFEQCQALFCNEVPSV